MNIKRNIKKLVGYQADVNICNYIRNKVRKSLKHQVHPFVRNQIFDQTWNLVDAQLKTQIRDKIRERMNEWDN